MQAKLGTLLMKVLLTLALGRNPLGKIQNEWDAMSAIQDFSLVKAIGSSPSGSRLSPELCRFLECCLQRNPDDRLSATELLKLPFIAAHAAKLAATSAGVAGFNGHGTDGPSFQPFPTRDISPRQIAAPDCTQERKDIRCVLVFYAVS